MLSYLIGAGVALLAYYAAEKTILRYVRRVFDPTHERSMRRHLFGKMSYDSLLCFKAALDAELLKRRGPLDG